MINQKVIVGEANPISSYHSDFLYGVSQNELGKRSPILLFSNFYERYFEIFGELPNVNERIL